MSSSLEHLTFSGLRRDHDRDWFRCSDLQDASQVAGYRMTRYQVQVATRHLDKPEKAYGHAHYTRAHLEAVVAWATAKAQEMAQESDDAELGA